MSEEVGALYPVAKKVLTPIFSAAWRFDVSGIENVPVDGPAIICPNHTSVLDSFFVPVVLPRRVTYVGKAEYMDDWKTRKIFPALGMIPIDREGGDAAERALSTAQRCLENDELFGIYPEGTRSRDGRLYRGHTGPARLAFRTGAPIIPVGLVGAREVMPPDAKFPKLRQRVRIRFGRPIEPSRYSNRPDDRLALRQMIDEVMYEIRELSGQEYVDEYATKKRSAPAASAVPRSEPPAQDRPIRVVPVPDAADPGGAGSRDGYPEVMPHQGPPAPGQRDLAAKESIDDSEFVAATARSSAELLKPPRRKVS